MNLVRLIIIAAAIWVAIYLLQRLLKAPPSGKPPASGAADDMVRCADCGLHLPKAEAITDHGRHYCCEEHRRRAPRP